MQMQEEDGLQALPEYLAYSDETCRAVAEEMATTGVTSMQVIDRETGRVCGTIGAQELLMGRKRAVERESERNRSFPVELQAKIAVRTTGGSNASSIATPARRWGGEICLTTPRSIIALRI